MAGPELLSRRAFREECLERDNHECVVPWCTEAPDEVHHIIERQLWSEGGYYTNNGASVCNHHHQAAEFNHIPPQAFWRWIGTEPVTPESIQVDSNKWGDPFETPPWEELRSYHKYPSTRHLPFSHIGDKDDTSHNEIEKFLEQPLVVTTKMDGSNAMLVKDADEPVRSRRGRKAEHDAFDLLQQRYWNNNVYGQLPEELQVFGEWLYAKHSIHYGCSGCCEDRHKGPKLEKGYFQVFGVFDTEFNLWLSWEETVKWANQLGFQTVPVINATITNKKSMFNHEWEIYEQLPTLGEVIVDEGHEGFVVRSKYPFHYGQFSERVGKYVRENHVSTDEHWKHKPTLQNRVK